VSNGISGIAYAEPYFARETNSVRLQATPFLCGTSMLGAGTSVTVDLTAIGGASAVALRDDGTGGDEVAGDGMFSVTATVAVGTSAGTKNLPLTFSDGTHSGGAYLGLVVEPASAPLNDNCASATALSGSFPIVLNDNFTGATVESNPIIASGALGTVNMGAKRGLWYTVVGTGHTLTVDTCASALVNGGAAIADTVIMVMCGTCDGLTILTSNDDSPSLCGVPHGADMERRSRASWCSRWARPTSFGSRRSPRVHRPSDTP